MAKMAMYGTKKKSKPPESVKRLIEDPTAFPLLEAIGESVQPTMIKVINDIISQNSK